MTPTSRDPGRGLRPMGDRWSPGGGIEGEAITQTCGPNLGRCSGAVGEGSRRDRSHARRRETFRTPALQVSVPDEARYMLLQLGEAARRRARMFFEEIYPQNARP
jgi:hypothetical protein